jgi:hypothetical protein
LADWQLVQKTHSLLKEVTGLLCLDSRINDRKALQSSGILDFSPQKPDSLIEMKAKSEFSPFLPLIFTLSPPAPPQTRPDRRPDKKSLNKQIPISKFLSVTYGPKEQKP